MKGINPDVLIWAREQTGLSVDDIASYFKKESSFIENWESGISSPTFPQLEKIANKYKRPTALFFFPEVPKEENIEKSFRAISDQNIFNIKPHLRHIIRKAKVMQINLSELNNGVNPAKKQLLDLINVRNKSIEQVASSLRDIIGISTEKQKTYKKTDTAFKAWRGILEKYGIYVFKDSFKDNGFSGFCLYDDVFPVIYINNSLPHSRQIFTLFHELAHLLFRNNGIEILSNEYKYDYFDNLTDNEKNEEIFCNSFAGKFLVPDDCFEKYLNSEVNDYNLSKASNDFSVSREVILRKFLDSNKINHNFYNQKVNEWRREYEDKIKFKKSSGGNPNYTKRAYLGENYIELAFGQYYKNNISTNELANYLDVSIKRIPKMESLIFEDRGYA